MELNIPNDFAPLLEQKATAAGFSDVAEYVVHLVQNDGVAGEPHDQEWIPEPNDPRITQAIDEGIASGDAGPMDDEFFARVKGELRAKYGSSEPSRAAD